MPYKLSRSDTGQYTILETTYRSTYFQTEFSLCYVIRSLKSLIPLETLRMIYFSSVHAIISYGIILLGNSSYSNAIFKLQKRVISIMMNARNKESCHELFKKLNILPLYSQYVLSLSLFVIKNINMFKSNSMIHSINTRHC